MCDTNFREDYFAEAELIHLVGMRNCTCFDIEEFSGTITKFNRLDHTFTCD